ncbi:MAG: hypothetical protein EBZ03_12880 [Betaproteobacteria bacterium]|nr:hypothetical protein [Betaproteobacteria bacterium]
MSTQHSSSADRFKYILLSPIAAKLLSAVAVGSLYLWFILKFFLTGEPTTLSLIVGLVGLIGIICSIVVFLCTYGFVANAPKKDLDERELQDRNAAYMSAYFYAVTILLTGYVGTDLIGKRPNPKQNFRPTDLIYSSIYKNDPCSVCDFLYRR